MHLDLLDIPNYYILAAFFGLAGQCIRATLGIIKTRRSDHKQLFSISYFSSTATLGCLSGILGGLIYDLGPMTPSTIPDEVLWNDRNFILMAISAGYFGADAIEGILGRHAPSDPKKYRSR